MPLYSCENYSVKLLPGLDNDVLMKNQYTLIIMVHIINIAINHEFKYEKKTQLIVILKISFNSPKIYS